MTTPILHHSSTKANLVTATTSTIAMTKHSDYLELTHDTIAATFNFNKIDTCSMLEKRHRGLGPPQNCLTWKQGN